MVYEKIVHNKQVVSRMQGLFNIWESVKFATLK